MTHLGTQCAAAFLVFAAVVCTTHADTSTEPRNLGQLKQELKDYHARDYPLQVATVLSAAEEWVKSRAAKVKKPALILDVDETSLSNWDEIAANDFAYIFNGPCSIPVQIPCGNLAWDQSFRATAIAPTLHLYQEATRLGVSVFFVTGRYDDPPEKSATELNLWLVGYRGWEGLVMRHDHTGTVAAYKTGARAQVEAEGFVIIANVGDQESDLVGGHSERTFKVPNPFYFIP